MTFKRSCLTQTILWNKSLPLIFSFPFPKVCWDLMGAWTQFSLFQFFPLKYMNLNNWFYLALYFSLIAWKPCFGKKKMLSERGISAVKPSLGFSPWNLACWTQTQGSALHWVYFTVVLYTQYKPWVSFPGVSKCLTHFGAGLTKHQLKQ